MAELAGYQDKLPSVVALVRHEIRQDVPDVQREVPPHIRLRRWHLAACGDAQFQKLLDAPAALPESGEESSALDLPQIDERRNRKPVLPAESPEPTAAGIVKMRGDQADGAPGDSRNWRVPQHGWQLLDEVGGNPAIRPPRSKHGRSQVGSCDRRTGQ